MKTSKLQKKYKFNRSNSLDRKRSIFDIMRNTEKKGQSKLESKQVSQVSIEPQKGFKIFVAGGPKVDSAIDSINNAIILETINSKNCEIAQKNTNKTTTIFVAGGPNIDKKIASANANLTK